jgi:membrane protein implicated in regulation of membrane protease activity
VLPKLAHSGTRNLASALGSEATVYLDIPAQGVGEVRVTVSGSVSHIKARARGGQPIKAGTPVTVCERIGQNLLIVEPLSTL